MAFTRRLFLSGAAAALGCGRLGRPAAPSSSAPDGSHRLPTTVVPRRYELHIAPDAGRRRFTGEATIEVEARQPVSEIVLNAAKLDLHAASIRQDGGRSLGGVVTLEPETERARIRFPAPLAPGAWRLTIGFAGVINDRLHGLYRSQASPAGAASAAGTLLATQFQAADARRVFPCWDEPAFKAVFQLTLVVDDGLTALSNTAVERVDTIPGTGKKAVRFAPTIPMSTYLVAFVVGELESADAGVVDGVPLRIWAVRGRAHLAGFAARMAAFALRFFREYYAVPYPGDKLDLIAVPDFETGAMENFGAVIFRETNLLVDEDRASFRELKAVADLVAHEVAHMWFGDLVTMGWWNGLWLNEAFATFMQVLAVDAWRPAWERWTAFAIDRTPAFEVDALGSTRPVEFPVRTPAEAEAMFDPLTYQKGAALVRMLEQHLGEDAFRRGLTTYLTRHRFANTETRDLWTALAEASAQPVADIMEGWVFRPGYPLVSVSTEAGGRALVFSQRRFSYAPEAPASEPWHVPVGFRVGVPDGIRQMRIVLSSPEARVELPAPAEWVVVNEEGHGFFRTRYAPALLAKLADDPFARLAPIERAQLVGDTWASARAGLVPVADYLDLTARFSPETDRAVWAAIIESLTYLERVVAAGDLTRLAALVRDRLGPAETRLGWAPAPGEDDARRALRDELLRALGTLGDDPATQAIAKERLARSYRDPSALDPGLVAAAIAIRAHAGTAADYQEFADRARNAATPQDAWRYVFALSRFREPALVDKTLAMILSGEVRSQDAPHLVKNLLMSVAARERAWRFVRQHWDVLERRWTRAGVAAMAEGVTALATPALAADVREFFASRRVALGGKTLEQYLERLGLAVTFREREGQALARYLAGFAGRSSGYDQRPIATPRVAVDAAGRSGASSAGSERR